MNFDELGGRLRSIYEEYDRQASAFVANAACSKGCALCCTDVGNIDITTLEGLFLLKQLDTLEAEVRSGIRQGLLRNKAERERGLLSRCPFLSDEQLCLVYEVRPFSCRQLYSLARCSGGPPTVHRGALDLARRTVMRIQDLDAMGYSGHLSYILHLLHGKGFRRQYLRGRSDPSTIAIFGRSHGIAINRFRRP